MAAAAAAAVTKLSCMGVDEKVNHSPKTTTGIKRKDPPIDDVFAFSYQPAPSSAAARRSQPPPPSPQPPPPTTTTTATPIILGPIASRVHQLEMENTYLQSRVVQLERQLQLYHNRNAWWNYQPFDYWPFK